MAWCCSTRPSANTGLSTHLTFPVVYGLNLHYFTNVLLPKSHHASNKHYSKLNSTRVSYIISCNICATLKPFHKLCLGMVSFLLSASSFHSDNKRLTEPTILAVAMALNELISWCGLPVLVIHLGKHDVSSGWFGFIRCCHNNKWWIFKIHKVEMHWLPGADFDNMV